MSNSAASPSPNLAFSHRRYFFERFGITERLLERCLGEALSGLWRKTLGVIEPFDRALRVEDDGSHGDRPGERATTDLVHARDQAVPARDLVVKSTVGRRSPHLRSYSSSRRAALPLSARR